MSATRIVWLVCDECGEYDREHGCDPVESVAAARATTHFIRRGKRDLCLDCATTPGPDAADDETRTA